MGLNLNVSDISKSYNGKPVLKGCFSSFDKERIYALTGPNGSGKSTFLRICSLIEEPDKGELQYLSQGNILKNDMDTKRRITLVLPGIGIFNASVFNNAAYGLKIRGIKGGELHEKTEKALSSVNLIHKKNQNALTLSSGEAQRLGIARAIVIEPEILFLDEPTAFVDQESKEIIEDIILKLKKNTRTKFIFTTHDTAQAERLADRILFMQDGKIS